MATQKQRRRRAKEKRHDYDLVYVDENGVEQPVEREESARKPPARTGKGGSTKQTSTAKSSGSSGRRARPVNPPSWRKVLRRGAIFTPIFFVTVYLLDNGKHGLSFVVSETILLSAVFIPFSYAMDSFVWRREQKRLGRSS
jgi:hypothetical protein